jgi:hypothetical protein
MGAADYDEAREAAAWLSAVTDDDLIAELARRELDNPDGIADYAERRALAERQRTLADARAVVQRECSAYPGASPAVTSGIWGGFDQWAVSEYTHLADPDRRLCADCGGRHTRYEYDDAHRNDEGGY